MTKHELFISEKAGSITLEIEPVYGAKYTLILAHGAGAGMGHPFMSSLAKGISELGVQVVRFNFPYKEKGKKMPGSPRESILALEKVAEYAIQSYPDSSVILSGKSYGGRMASHLVAEQPDLGISGLIYFGFPLHAPGRNTTERANHLAEIEVPQLFLQGTNDALANHELIAQVVSIQKNAQLVSFDQADHSFKTPKTALKKTEEIFQELIDQSTSWIQKIK